MSSSQYVDTRCIVVRSLSRSDNGIDSLSERAPFGAIGNADDSSEVIFSHWAYVGVFSSGNGEDRDVLLLLNKF